MAEVVSLRRLLFGNYLEGALYCPGGTDHFTHRAPSGAQLTFSLLIYFDRVTNEHQNLTLADLHTEPTAVAVISVDNRHFGHLSHFLHTAIV